MGFNLAFKGLSEEALGPEVRPSVRIGYEASWFLSVRLRTETNGRVRTSGWTSSPPADTADTELTL
jgi:hypothetical protein